MFFMRFLRAVRRSLPQVVPLMRDALVPGWLKVATVALAVLIVSPLDLFGDIPVLGLLDDAALLALLANAFVAFAARYAVQSAVVRSEPPMKRATPVLYRLPR
jgi:uncharacterized membrane protein YkvA (DUF1232 family)